MPPEVLLCFRMNNSLEGPVRQRRGRGSEEERRALVFLMNFFAPLVAHRNYFFSYMVGGLA